MAFDRGFTFPQRKNSKGFIEMTDDVRLLVHYSILQILGTPIGSRVIEVEFGSRLRECLFEPIDEITISLARLYTIQAIERWEPRVFLNDVAVSINHDLGVVQIFGIYTIKGTQSAENFQVAFPLKRAG